MGYDAIAAAGADFRGSTVMLRLSPVVLPIAIALQVGGLTASFAQNASSSASRDCQSSDTDRRLRGCTQVINARGFGSQSNLADALDGRCWAYNDKEQFMLAIADCKASIRLRPRNFYAYNNLGTAYVGIGDYKDALSAFDTAIELKPDFYWSRFNRAKALVVVGRKEDAIRDYEYLLNRDPANQGIRNLLNELRAAIATQPGPNPPSTSDSRVSFGTGFFVSSSGHVLTNQHVVNGCVTVSVSRPGSSGSEARIAGSDPRNDLALLATDMRPVKVSTFRTGLHLGETVFVYGFPLVGLLSTTGNFTVGNVTAMSGVGDDTRMFQISAPVQPGNSGGPLLDKFGNVVGVIVSKLDVLRVAKVTDDIAQNINFAIKIGAAVNFMEANDVRSSEKENTSPLEATDIADRAKLFTVQIKCKL
jgi:S1-C subfamily serine protease